MESDFQCLFMGDILFRSETTIGIEMTTSDPATYSWSEVVEAGAWFSSALTTLQYMVSAWNEQNSGQMRVYLVSDPTDSNYRKFEFVPDGGFGAITALRVQVGAPFEDFGLTSVDHDLGAGSDTKYSAAAPLVFAPYWPLAKYTTGIDVLSGYSEMAHDGTMYSHAGQTQRTITMSVALERTSGFDETVAWMKLWRDRWTRGRAVTFIMDRENVYYNTGLYPDPLLEADVLELPSNGETVDFSRMIDLKEQINYTRPVKFVHRQIRKGEDRQSYNAHQMSAVPSTDPRVLGWYRASRGFSLVMDFSGLPDPEDCAGSFWYRPRWADTGNWSLFSDPEAPGDQIVFANDPTDSHIDNAGGNTAASVPFFGTWNHLAWNSAGGEISWFHNGVVAPDPFMIGGIGGASTFGDNSGAVFEADFANIGLFSSGVMSEANAAALYSAGVNWDLVDPYGAWAGVEPYWYICGLSETIDTDFYQYNSSNHPSTPGSGGLLFATTPVAGNLVAS